MEGSRSLSVLGDKVDFQFDLIENFGPVVLKNLIRRLYSCSENNVDEKCSISFCLVKGVYSGLKGLRGHKSVRD